MRDAITFDNLGEAADLERGLWPEERPIGRHPSVTEALPWLLDTLDGLGVRATFCVEAINCEMYPDALLGIAARGHEVAMHGWRHEEWAELDPDAEAALLARGRAAFAALGLEVRGFRPPGGGLTSRTLDVLAAEGFAWCSPAAEAAPAAAPVALRPFTWPLVDATYRLRSFAGRETLGPEETAERLCAELDAAGDGAVLILHPFLMLSDEARAASARVLAHAAG